MQEKRLLQKGYSEAEATEFSRIGVVREDQYWVWIRDAVYFPKGVPGTYDRLVWKNELNGGAPGVAVLPVLPSGKIVLNLNYRHATRSWELELPRGKREQGETLEEAALREVKEETGFDIQISGVVGLYSKPGADALAITFKGNIVGGQRQVADGEVQEVGFFALDAIPNPVRAHFHQRLADYCAGEQQPFLRTQ